MLSGADIDKLSRKLATALDDNTLQQFVHASTGDRLYVEYVGPGRPLRPTIVDLINALEERGITPLFLRYVYVRRSGRPDVQQIIAQVCPEALGAQPESGSTLSAQTSGAVQPDAPTTAGAPGLQRNVRPYLAKLDVRVWLERLMRIERQVCRIEFDGNAAGTGFLVGPDAVLTNWHVVEPVAKQNQIGGLSCRFDYLKLANGSVQPGQVTALHADGCLDSSRYSPAETTNTPETPPPTADELDYALLRTATRVGDEQSGGAQRGWIVLPMAAQPVAANGPLLIVQHPKGEPMKLALDTEAVIGLNASQTRLRYRTNTDPGASGSPCFTMDWDIVALHHYGDPTWQNPLFNQGVPIHLIAARIKAKGFGERLGS